MKKLSNDETFLLNLGQRLREIRESHSWTLEQTEEHGWPSWRHLQKIETGKNVPILTLYKLSKLYKIPLSEILNGI